LLSVPAGGGGAASSVAGGQDPVLRRLGEAGIRLQSPSSRPSNPLPYQMDQMARAQVANVL